MLSQLNSNSLHPFNCNEFSIHTKKFRALTSSRVSFSISARNSTASPPPATPDPIRGQLIPKQQMPNSPPSWNSLVVVAPPIAADKNLGFRPIPELGLMSHLFVFTMAFGAFFSVALVSIPTLIAFGRLGASVKKLSRVVSEEVPGTLSSLKLSTMELNDLTQQLSNLRNIQQSSKGEKTPWTQCKFWAQNFWNSPSDEGWEHYRF